MIYLDYQATTPLAPEARDAMLRWLDGRAANPHSPHRAGREAAAAVELAREQVAAPLGAGRLIFASGATEAANTAIQGVMQSSDRRRLVTIATEHACVLDTAAAMGGDGAEVVILPVGPDGLVDMAAAEAAIDSRCALVSVMHVNNEIGVVQPIEALASLARKAGAPLHLDAAQGYGKLPIPRGAADFISISAHKIYGPIGIGALWMADGRSLPGLLHGGGQEAGIRSGTISPALAAGFGAAAALAFARMDEDKAHVERLARQLRASLPDWTWNGAEQPRWPGNANLRHQGVEAARLISELRGLAFSAGSACASGSGRPSHVLKAIGLSDAEARASIRLGFGRYTTADEITQATAMIREAAARQMEWAA
ncbi:cysteine desulfurase [Sphingomonas laterariae]|uniref:Cysteine desulfurase n=1 Tax=Edaphosphingomonas laterariae TaxID=861865 RepID=A0A239JJI0_9SPHN|nr:cysteine desulfurase family protein [Sphingomonas laterariae]SNT04904.1 cysteine desulfurase [Sphingomonas laterariae]